ncbi:MAG: hypothetical protein HPY55_07240 [Firmicutes bacterium]|nr:hypothetical protein [Bacillota bacterium]
MIGKLYEERKRDKEDNLRQNREPNHQNDASGNTSEAIAEEYKVGKATVERAASTHQFAGAVIKKELARLMYVSKPGLETAVSLLKYAPDFVVFFEESKPGGFFTRYLNAVDRP